MITPAELTTRLAWRYATKKFDSTRACAVGYRAGEDTYARVAQVRFPESDMIEVRG